EWAKDLEKLSTLLINQKILPEEWQRGINRIYSQTNIGLMLRDLDFEGVKAGMDSSKPGGHWNQIFIEGFTNRSIKTKFITKIVALQKGRSVPPHGHENEV